MSNCFLFDNDGTLVDSERLSSIGLVSMFQNLGVRLDADELVAKFRGWKLAKIQSLLEAQYEISLAEEFVSEYRAIVSDLFQRELRPIEGVEEALEAIDSPKAVVSNGPLSKIKQTLEICGLNKYFGENLFSSYEVGIWKPDPGIYLHAAKAMGSSPSNCFVIDDGPVGVEAGSAAGMKTMFFNRFNEECSIPGVISFNSMVALPHLARTGQPKLRHCVQGLLPGQQAAISKKQSQCVRIVGLLLGWLSPDPDDCRAPSLLSE